MKRENILTDSPLGDFYGYSRAVRKGPFVSVSGTMAANEKGERQGDDGYSETKYILAKIEASLQDAGAKIEDVVRTRIFLTDISETEGVAKAHGEIFKDIKPASTLVEVKSLIAPGYLVEIEADAIIDEQ
jgi:enamine deaminase RidA (YjgF/YER057c/UK114 family)